MNINLKILLPEDVTQKYVDWFSDPEVVKFSEKKTKKFTLQGQIDYVNSCLTDPNKVLYGVFDDKLHIGNFYLEDLESIHKRVKFACVIGDKSYWNKGVSTDALSKLIKLVTSKYKIYKIFADVVEGNIGSCRFLEKNNFILEGKRIDHIFLDGKFYNLLEYALIINQNLSSK
jgi:[ribosomal protein S5]-alanine N-acetyltransferase